MFLQTLFRVAPATAAPLHAHATASATESNLSHHGSRLPRKNRHVRSRIRRHPLRTTCPPTPPQPGTPCPDGLNRRFDTLHVHTLQVVQLPVQLLQLLLQAALALLQLRHLQAHASRTQALSTLSSNRAAATIQAPPYLVLLPTQALPQRITLLHHCRQLRVKHAFERLHVLLHACSCSRQRVEAALGDAFGPRAEAR